MKQMDKLNIPNPTALDMGEMLGITQVRRDEISAQLDQMMKDGTNGRPRLVYASDVLRRIEEMCATKEEFIWAIINHIQWMERTRRMAASKKEQDALIAKYGPPENL